MANDDTFLPCLLFQYSEAWPSTVRAVLLAAPHLKTDRILPSETRRQPGAIYGRKTGKGRRLQKPRDANTCAADDTRATKYSLPRSNFKA
jgi:hypothetical protein